MKATINNSLLPKLKPQSKHYDIWDDKLGGFHLRVNPNGKIVYRCAYARNKVATIGKGEILTPSEARDRAKQILGEAAVGVYPGSPSEKGRANISLQDFLRKDYKEWRKLHRKNADADLKRLEVNFLPDFGHVKLIEITPFSVEKWRNKRLAAKRKSATINRDLTILKATLSKAVEWKFIENNPLLQFKPLKVDKASKVRFLDKEEVARLREAIEIREEKLLAARISANAWREERGYKKLPDDPCDYMKSLIFISMNTGLRRGEILSLNWEDVDLDHAVLTVVGDTAKSGKTRHVPMNKEVLVILENWRERTDSKKLVFQNRDGKQLAGIKTAWAGILSAAKIKNFRWHDLRHHFASKLAIGGVDLNTIRELLGHSTIQMTLRYAHLTPQHKAKAVAVLMEE